MFNRTPSEADSKLDEVIAQLLEQMKDEPSFSEEYVKMLKQLTKLYSLKEKQSRKRVSPDTLAIVIGNLLGIVVIVGHERAHVVTSKALNFIMKAAK